MPVAKLLVVHVACPPLNATVPQLPMLQVTLPVGTQFPKPCWFAHVLPALASVTVAVNVTLCPYTDGFVLELTLVALVAWFTVCATLPLLPEWLLSPAYVAVTVSLGAINALVTQVATPGFPLSVEGEQPVFALHVTLPVGANRTTVPFLVRIRPFSPVTVAVNVTLCP